MATYTKLRDGSWGIKGTGLTPGARVTVTKRDGETKEETVRAILWTGPDGTQLATLHAGQRASRSTGSSPRRRRRGGSYECKECGDYVTPGSQCWETGMEH